MTTPRARVGAFAKRLGDLIEGDMADPDFILAVDAEFDLDESGRVTCEHTGAEAILIVRGPQAGRGTAIARLLATLQARQ